MARSLFIQLGNIIVPPLHLKVVRGSQQYDAEQTIQKHGHAIRCTPPSQAFESKNCTAASSGMPARSAIAAYAFQSHGTSQIVLHLNPARLSKELHVATHCGCQATAPF